MNINKISDIFSIIFSFDYQDDRINMQKNKQKTIWIYKIIHVAVHVSVEKGRVNLILTAKMLSRRSKQL